MHAPNSVGHFSAPFFSSEIEKQELVEKAIKDRQEKYFTTYSPDKKIILSKKINTYTQKNKRIK